MVKYRVYNFRACLCYLVSNNFSAAVWYRLYLIISMMLISYLIYSLAFEKPRSNLFGAQHFLAKPQARHEGIRFLQYSLGLNKS